MAPDHRTRDPADLIDPAESRATGSRSDHTQDVVIRRRYLVGVHSGRSPNFECHQRQNARPNGDIPAPWAVRWHRSARRVGKLPPTEDHPQYHPVSSAKCQPMLSCRLCPRAAAAVRSLPLPGARYGARLTLRSGRFSPRCRNERRPRADRVQRACLERAPRPRLRWSRVAREQWRETSAVERPSPPRSGNFACGIASPLEARHAGRV